MIINDLVRPVIGKLRGRSDAAPNIPYWIAQVLLDLTTDHEFSYLQITGPLTNFVANLAEYPLAGYDPNGINGNPFVASNDHRITFVKTFFSYFDTTGTITSGVSTGYELKARDIRVVEPMSKILGQPSAYCLFGDKRFNGKLIIGNMPNINYPCQMRYQREHPFNTTYEQVLQAYGSNVLNSQIAASQIYIPNSWTDIIVYAAAEKACDDLGMTEIGQLYHQKLFGYKDKRGNEMPGLITARMSQDDRQTSFNSRQLRPIVRRYT